MASRAQAKLGPCAWDMYLEDWKDARELMNLSFQFETFCSGWSQKYPVTAHQWTWKHSQLSPPQQNHWRVRETHKKTVLPNHCKPQKPGGKPPTKSHCKADHKTKTCQWSIARGELAGWVSGKFATLPLSATNAAVALNTKALEVGEGLCGMLGIFRFIQGKALESLGFSTCFWCKLHGADALNALLKLPGWERHSQWSHRCTGRRGFQLKRLKMDDLSWPLPASLLDMKAELVRWGVEI